MCVTSLFIVTKVCKQIRSLSVGVEINKLCYMDVWWDSAGHEYVMRCWVMKMRQKKVKWARQREKSTQSSFMLHEPKYKAVQKRKTMEILTGWWQQPGLGGGGWNGWSLCAAVKLLCAALSLWVPVTPHLPKAIGCEYQKQTLVWTMDEGHNVPLVDTLCHLSHPLWQMNFWGASIDIGAGSAYVQRGYFCTFR